MSDNDKRPLGLRLSAVALLLGIFAAGAFTGAGIYHWAVRGHGPMGPPGVFGPRGMHRELGLTDAQAKQVDAIMEKYHPELEAVMRESFPRLRSVGDKIDAEIRPLLNDEQRRRFDEMKLHRPAPGMRASRKGGPPVFGPDGPRFGPPGDMPPPDMPMPGPAPSGP